jgi:hypothetical protein
MAEIDVVPKHRSGLSWLWIVLIAVAAVIVLWWFMGNRTAANRTGGVISPQPAFASIASETLAA